METSNPSSLENRVYWEVIQSLPKAMIVDMDETIYWEKSFIEPYVVQMSMLVEKEIGTVSAKQFMNFYLESWESGSRRNLFQECIAKFSITSITPTRFLEEMRSFRVKNGLPIRAWAQRVFREISVPTIILTNGDPEVQRNKFSQLTPQGALLHSTLVCAKEIASKPSTLAVENAIRFWNLTPEDVVFVGDSEIDRKCAYESGCRFIKAV